VGPGGDYLTTPHTRDHYREVWYPRVFDRQTYGAWRDKGQPTALENARHTALQAIAAHSPTPLPPAIEESLRAIVAEADARAGKPPQEDRS